MSVRIGAKVPNSGPLPGTIGISEMARVLEQAGFQSLWVADHVVLPAEIGSRYPFAADGRATWSTTTPYFDAVVAMALIAGATERATIGTAVLVLPLRNPVVFAKQAASLDVLSGGRLALGLGAGWLREEFEALGVPFDARGRRLVDGIRILGECWTGTYQEDIVFSPTPVGPLPLYVGGHSEIALRRAGALGDGWLGQQSLDAVDTHELEAAHAAITLAAADAGRDPARLRVVLRIVDSAGRSDEVARRLPALEAAGVDEVIVDLDWDGDPAADYARMAA
ncbi:MAG TPA: TIGR03619 family F420-dependent LLM class oxidoreductase [Gaiella sp.]|jgi:probable F420-dependent oxidoreductase|nr:TIGR03619 family F420-dependent LLM class oxidoreductase [Gaiella sp.]